ncbi:MAG: hypothetical protein MAG451_00505 [Anaerolineales bacterium]|nr:hypothetical protein [Anaerolineales bacterium]
MAVTQVHVTPAKPAGLFHIESLTLISDSQRHTMADLLGLGRHELAYRDPDVVVYDNLDALPRTFVVHHARLVPDDETALAIIDNPTFDPQMEVLLASPSHAVQGSRGAEEHGRFRAQPTAHITHYSPQRVEIQADLDRSGYLVLLDSYYPGWQATVDGRPATIHRADVLFRAVALGPGRHTVTFIYDPSTFKIGAVISALTLVILAVTAGLMLLGRDSGREPT